MILKRGDFNAIRNLAIAIQSGVQMSDENRRKFFGEKSLNLCCTRVIELLDKCKLENELQRQTKRARRPPETNTISG